MQINAPAFTNGAGESGRAGSMVETPSVRAPSMNFTPRSSSSGEALSSIQGFSELARNGGAIEAARASREVMQTAANLISDFLESSGRTLDVSVDSASDALVLRVMDKNSGELIRQIPSEEALTILRFLQMTGAALVNRVA